MAGRKSTFDKLRDRERELSSGDARGGKRTAKNRKPVLTPPPERKRRKKQKPVKEQEERY